MKRNIVVLADGTGNSAGKAFKTNVWRLYQALDLGGAGQIASFSDGVGTSQFKPFEIIGLALGFGIKRRVLALYKFLCRNYRDGDDIYAFGFSRGAFTVRLLVGMISLEGLVDFKSSEELDRNALAAYRAFRKDAFSTWMPWVKVGRWARDFVVENWNGAIGNRQYSEAKPAAGPRSAGEMRIKFLGVWDTVAAYGLPVDELTRAVNGVVWPMTFENKQLLDCVERARQAFSIDDERRTFFPIRWDKPKFGLGDPARLQQVWFAGSHSNVGGGYPDDRLAHVPLCWMIGEAAECGLVFKPEAVAEYWDLASETGRIYDSRSAYGIFYRYHPRSVVDLTEPDEVPLVHSSVILRMADGSDGYAPVSLPRDIDVLTPLGDRVGLQQIVALGGKAKRGVVDKLPLPKSRKRDLDKMQADLSSAMHQLRDGGTKESYDERANLMQDTVWWRRGFYYVLLLLTVVAALFPLLTDYARHQSTDDIDLQVRPLVGPVIGLLKGLLPGFTAFWTDAIARSPTYAFILALLLGICLWLNGLLRTRIEDRARAVWNVKVRKDGGSLDANRATAHRYTAMLGFLLFAPLALVAFLRERQNFGWALAGIAAVSLAAFFLTRRNKYRGRDRGGMLSLLGFARAIRTNGVAIKIYWLLRTWILPGVFLIAATVVVLGAANKVAFSIADSVGSYCLPPKKGVRVEPGRKLPLDAPFATSEMCWDTGIEVKEGVTYRVAFAVAEPWKDGSYNADPYGFAATTHGLKAALIFAPGTVFKRWWSQPWIQPIARVGRRGNDEYALSPLQPADNVVGKNGSMVAEFTARTTGELYLYVNDAALALPGLSDFFYRDNNHGTANVTITAFEK